MLPPSLVVVLLSVHISMLAMVMARKACLPNEVTRANFHKVSSLVARPCLSSLLHTALEKPLVREWLVSFAFRVVVLNCTCTLTWSVPEQLHV